MLQIHESTTHRVFLARLVLMEATFQCFNLKPANCSLAPTILKHKLFQLRETLITGKALVRSSLIGMRLMLSKIHPGAICDFNTVEE